MSDNTGDGEGEQRQLQQQLLPSFSTFEDLQQAMFQSLVPAVKASVQVPKGDDHLYFSTIPEFKTKTRDLQQRLLRQIEGLAKLEHGHLEGWSRDDMDEQMSYLTEINDLCMERVSMFLDDKRGANRASAALEHRLGKHAVHTVSIGAGAGSWNKTAPGMRVLQATNIARPQLLFTDAIDNTSTPFRPKLTRKPHAMRDLNLQAIRVHGPGTAAAPAGAGDDEEETVVYYEHPYEHELRAFQPVADAANIRQKRSIDECANNPATFVNTVDQLQDVLSALKGEREVAVDLEAHNVRSYQGFTCLMQVSTRTRDFLIDTLALRGHLEVLNECLCVLHGADSDILWLQRDHGLYIVCLFVCLFAMRVLGYPKYSLAYLLKHLFHLSLDKRHQLSDWRIRPLPADMCVYAQADTHYLLDAHDALKAELLERGNENANLLRSVFTRSTDICLQRYEVPKYDEEQAMRLYNRQSLALTPKGLAIFRALHAWRDAVARREDESPRYVMEDHMLFSLARNAPTQPSQVFAICQPTPTLVRMNAHTIIETITNAQLGLTDADRLAAETADGSTVLTTDHVSGGRDVQSVLSHDTVKPADDTKQRYQLAMPRLQDLDLSSAGLVKRSSTRFGQALAAQKSTKVSSVAADILHSFARTPLFAATPKEILDMHSDEHADEEKKEEGGVSDSQPEPETEEKKQQQSGSGDGDAIVVEDSDNEDDIMILSEVKQREEEQKKRRTEEDDRDDLLGEISISTKGDKRSKRSKNKKDKKGKKGKKGSADSSESKKGKKKERKPKSGEWRRTHAQTESPSSSASSGPAKKRAKFDPFAASAAQKRKKGSRTKQRGGSRTGSMKVRR
ncbi:hypothetical protein PTSG_07367 [Salpingoeca rosetta]|uniref:HRDC domain-containing protein n=1 Tax=Salpingoeca rosetta (strain ATCC 50818 / BSB-021) TaxID=946362 RepID=F2UJ77_SALR5|nr:uncharacterized protein PTSG_07367 [Salpingoeca rosetta]EGD77025.1 hypothetical protein PTSG_07367 [Salpingoeca rosetta]|eukprot:XP_004990865.1 hypothetical protein PTSG_07367 [Salpingoeca rosetta]